MSSAAHCRKASCTSQRRGRYPERLPETGAKRNGAANETPFQPKAVLQVHVAACRLSAPDEGAPQLIVTLSLIRQQRLYGYCHSLEHQAHNSGRRIYVSAVCSGQGQPKSILMAKCRSAARQATVTLVASVHGAHSVHT